MLEKHFVMNFNEIYENEKLNKLYNSLKNEFKQKDGLSDSIKTCLLNYQDKSYRFMLDDLTKPDFIKEDEEFQILIQYLIISG